VKKYYTMIIIGLMLYSSPAHLRADCSDACHEGVEACFTRCESHMGKGQGICHSICDPAYTACAHTQSPNGSEIYCSHSCDEEGAECYKQCQYFLISHHPFCHSICNATYFACTKRPQPSGKASSSKKTTSTGKQQKTPQKQAPQR
jgi:hypothetical protein